MDDRATTPASLALVSTVDALTAALRKRILDGELEPGRRLPERDLTERYEVARHSVRAALRALAAERLVVIEPNRGASVAHLDESGLRSLFELRTALELEAAHLALERNGGRLPRNVHHAVTRLSATCARRDPAWSEVSEAHNGAHLALVRAARSERIARAYDSLASELRLFVTAIRPHWSLERMAAQHEQLIAELETSGPSVVRGHLAQGLESVLP